MNINISNASGEPIYLQIASQIKTLILEGKLKEGDALPSMRTLAAELRICFMTTKRAYEELEKEGVIESVPGRGFFVCEQKNDHLREKQMIQIESQFMELIRDSKNAGMTLEDVLEMVKVLFMED